MNTRVTPESHVQLFDDGAMIWQGPIEDFARDNDFDIDEIISALTADGVADYGSGAAPEFRLVLIDDFEWAAA